MQEVMDVYQRSVFSREVVRRLLPLHYEDLLYRLQQTLQHCSLTQAEVITNPPFSSVISSLNTSCQGREELRLMNVTLDVYMRIFSNILHHQHKPGTLALLDQVSDSQRSKVKEDLKELRGKMEALKRHLNHPSHDREDVVNKLNKIKVDDPLVQKKALAQFKEVFQAASVVVDRRC
ncbi:interferon gamma 1-like [Acanthopagrus latus]|uniref:interferon gamma 1-like n=1 Tax=Acanthopagrus latus TaxID=8177 RepID=UPI00187CD82B|nr:interferon gamma 1-like [Acanthopagrus latus]